jgi:hypothetical protein
MEYVVELARLYEANPLLAVRNLCWMYGSEFLKVFQFGWREGTSKSGELPECEGYWTVSGEPDQDFDLLTEIQDQYVRRINLIRRALLLAARSRPEVFEVLDLQLLDKFRLAAGEIRSSRPAPESFASLRTGELQENLADFARWVELKGFGPKVSDKAAEDTGESIPEATFSDADRIKIADALNGQQLKLFNVLWACNSAKPDRWKYYGDLKAIRAERIWRTQPDSDEISDATVFEALRKLQKAMPPESPYVVTIENESGRVKLRR